MSIYFFLFFIYLIKYIIKSDYQNFNTNSLSEKTVIQMYNCNTYFIYNLQLYIKYFIPIKLGR